MHSVDFVAAIDSPSIDRAQEEKTLRQLSQGPPGRSLETNDRAARDFEAFLIQFTLKEMRKTIQHSDLFGDRNAMQLIESMFDDAISKEISKGPGIGLADKLRDHFGGDTTDRVALKTPAHPPGEFWKGCRITSRFGERIHPITGELDLHEGVDIAAPEGTPVKAVGDGVVTFAGDMKGYGNVVIISHANGYSSRYAHNSEIRVQQGQEVTADTVIAESGSTGSSTGPHVHFEMRNNKKAVDPSMVPGILRPVGR